MLQCTAVTDVPEADVLAALTTMPGGPDDPRDTRLDGHVLCELGEHDEQAEHAARLWAADPPVMRDLWLLWTGTGTRRVRRCVGLRPCPAVLRRLSTDSVCQCSLSTTTPPTTPGT